ncbi:MAG: MFS transporter [Promethearchaeota archaeon]|nr:MAG: MFS transporter [Candidatus Lokiarchaeota archaeon]
MDIAANGETPDLKTESGNNYRLQKFYYLIIKIPFTLMPGVFSMIYVYFFWDYLNMSQTLFNIGMIVYGIFNALNDPLLGQWSDRVNVNKWGSRRLIFIKYGGPIWAILFFVMWIPWSFDNSTIIFIHFIITMVFYDNFLTVVILVWDALLPEIAKSHEDRIKIFFLGGLVGTIGGIPVLFALSIFKAGLMGFRIFTGVIAIVSAVIFYISASKLRERPELHQEKNIPGLFRSLKQCLSSKSFVTFTLYRFFRVINDTMSFSFMFVYALLFPSGFETILVIVYAIGGIIGQWFYLKLSEKRPIHSMIMVGGIIQISISVIAFLISLIQGTEIFWYVLLFISILMGGYSVFVNPYLLLVADEDEMKFKTRREGMFLGTNAIFNKIAESMGPILAVAVLTYFGYLQNVENYIPTETTLFGIKILLFIVPSIMTILGLIALMFYPIKGDNLKKLKEDIEATHKEKKKEYLNPNIRKET